MKKESKKMEKQEMKYLKKGGAPKKVMAEEKAEIKKMANGGKAMKKKC